MVLEKYRVYFVILNLVFIIGTQKLFTSLYFFRSRIDYYSFQITIAFIISSCPIISY